MSIIAQNYIDTKEAEKVARKKHEAACFKQFGSASWCKAEYNSETQAAWLELCAASDAAHKARSIAFQNGGDFALPVSQ